MAHRVFFRASVAAGLALAASLSAFGPAAAQSSSSAASDAKGSFQVAQACGWYAISVCSRKYGPAQRAANRYGGYVVDTSSGAYPNFRGGWYCAVVGPKNRSAAKSTAALMRRRGASSAYVKNGC